MRESAKACLALVIIVAAFVTPIVWLDEARANSAIVWWRYGMPAVALIALVILLRLHWKKDSLPDFLREAVGGYFERNGFCFSILLAERNGVCWLCFYYQNKYERSCKASVTVKPSFGFFLTTRKLDAINLEIDCGPAAFGLVRVPWGIPQQYQGESQRLDVGASVRYPNGRGRCLRFRDGVRVGKHRYHNQGWVHALVVMCSVGTMRLSRPASVSLKLPGNVAETVEDVSIDTREVWRLGDPMIQPVSLQVSSLLNSNS